MDTFRRLKESIAQSFKAKEIRYLAITVGVFAVVLVVAVLGGTGDIEVSKGSSLLNKFNLPVKKTTNSVCDNPKNRPVAVMISSDYVARPLSGIGFADVVFEMPVTSNGVTRMMAVYQCYEPYEIGSIRSSRVDFIPLVQGIDAIYSHWGGEKTALKELNSGILDNIDGLLYDGTVYYRKSGIPMPHDGFTSFERLMKKAVELGYGIQSSDIGFTYAVKNEKQSIPSTVFAVADPPSVYNDQFEVSWKYDPVENIYQRSRGGKPEKEKTNGEIVSVSNVIIMKTTWSPINKDYINVKTVGSGDATIYRDGKAFTGKWEKESVDSLLTFKNSDGKDVVLTRGKTWVLIDAGI